jgi:hypothetical protein
MFVMVALLAPGVARAESKLACLGLTLPAGSKKMGNDPRECRFASSLNWDETVKFFDRGLPSSQTRWHREVNIPAAKYRHVESTNSKTPWEGFNIYQVGGDPSAEIRLYVIPRAEEAKPRKTSGEDARKKKEKSKEKEKKKGK